MTTRKTKSASKQSTKKSSKSKARAKNKPAAASKTDGRLRVRMYRVGFGDFFLVIVPTSNGDQHILIDCGVFKGTSGTGDIGSIVEAVEDMYKTTNGHLALVIMTHRHADHIAGFSKAERFKDFTASMVWMPYWEQFNDDTKSSGHHLQLDAQGLAANFANVALKLGAGEDAEAKEALAQLGNAAGNEDGNNSAHDLLMNIDELAANLGMQFRGRADADAQEALAQLGNATGIEDFNAAARSKKKAGGNAAALELLKNHLGQNGKKVRYYSAGDKPDLPSELKDLKATILGPPPEKAKAFLALMDLKKGVGQYLDSMNESDDGPKAIQPFSWEWASDAKSHYPKKDVRGFPIDYDKCIQDLHNSQPDMLVAAAAKIENFLNNQSLVVLFEFDGKKLLFAGDAQGGNWEYWLFKTDAPQKDPTKAGDIIETSKELLQTIDFYKVGHHGSTNATPIQAIEAAIARPKTSKGFVAMCSTEDGVYGNPKKETEVPRTRLMEVLEKDSCLVRSDAIEISVTDATTNKTKTIGAREGVKLPRPKAGKLSKARLYLEYAF
jgi:beta-lactamase superfamily II metal-dependent hydrolase